MSMKIVYQQSHIDRVLQYYVDGLKLPKGEKLYDYEAVYDPHSGKVVFILTIEEALVKEEPK